MPDVRSILVGPTVSFALFVPGVAADPRGARPGPTAAPPPEPSADVAHTRAIASSPESQVEAPSRSNRLSGSSGRANINAGDGSGRLSLERCRALWPGLGDDELLAARDQAYALAEVLIDVAPRGPVHPR